MASDPSTLMSADPLPGRLRAGRCRGGRRRTAAHQAGHAVIDDAHELEPREIRERLYAHAALAGLDDLADRDADREAAAMARGDDAIATLHAGHALQQREAKLRGIVAGQDGAFARALDQHRQARVDVGDEQHARAVVADLGDAPGQTLAGDHRLAMRHTDATAD